MFSAREMQPQGAGALTRGAERAGTVGRAAGTSVWPRSSSPAADAERDESCRPQPAMSNGVLATVVLPVFNESGLIDQTLDAVAAFAQDQPGYLFIFVDDGSTDQTASMILAKLEAWQVSGRDIRHRVRLQVLDCNRGKGEAVKFGVMLATSPIVLFTDGDLAYALDHLPRLVQALDHADVVIGNRNLARRLGRNTPLLRRFMGWTFNRCARAILGLRCSDTQAGLKGFRTEAARRIFALEHLGGFAFDVEVVYLAQRLGYRIAEVPAFVADAHACKVSKVSLLRDPGRMFAALVDVRLSALRGRYDVR
jgi:dolichyl-phosphate beta-glucosyltransferase